MIKFRLPVGVLVIKIVRGRPHWNLEVQGKKIVPTESLPCSRMKYQWERITMPIIKLLNN